MGAFGLTLAFGINVCPLAASDLCINPGTAGDCLATDGAAPGGVCGGGIPTPTPL